MLRRNEYMCICIYCVYYFKYTRVGLFLSFYAFYNRDVCTSLSVSDMREWGGDCTREAYYTEPTPRIYNLTLMTVTICNPLRRRKKRAFWHQTHKFSYITILNISVKRGTLYIYTYNWCIYFILIFDKNLRKPVSLR